MYYRYNLNIPPKNKISTTLWAKATQGPADAEEGTENLETGFSPN